MKLIGKETLIEQAQAKPFTWWLRSVRSARSEILVVAILLIGFSLRVYDLGTESLWIDEGTSIQLARLSLPQIIENRSQSVNPPLYFIVLHYWVRLFGESEFSIRLPSVVFGSLALVMIYRLGDLIFGKKVGTLSCLLLAISVFHISYSQEARGYSLMGLLALISMFFFIKLLVRANFAFLIGYVFSSSLLMYNHFFGLLIIVAQNIYLITMIIFSEDEYEFNFKRWILAQGMLVVLYIPWIRFLITQIVGIQEGYWIPTPTVRSIIETFLKYSAGSKLLLLCFLALSFFSTLTYKRTAGKINWKTLFRSIDGYSWSLSLSNSAKIYLLLLWLAVPIILPFVISQISTPIYYTRYTIVASLAFYILIARGVKNIDNIYIRLSVVIITIIYCILGISEYYIQVNKQQWRELTDYLEKNAKTGDLLLFNAGGIKDSAFAYYFEREDVIQKPINLEIDLVTEHTRFYRRNGIDSLEPTVRGHNRVWLILAHSNDKQGLIKSELSKLYFLSYHHKYVGIEVYLFEEPQQLVTQEICYHMPEAGEVFLVWGINGWQMVAGETRPEGTVVKDAVMHTPMDREGDTFVAKVQVPAGATINYGFLITGSRSGAIIEAVWDGDQDDLIATEDGVVEMETTLTLAHDQAPASVVNAPLVTQEIRYHMPEAGEVFLVWGINEWNVVPEENRPAGTEIKDKVMHTPMVQEGDTFVAKVQVPSGATIDYGFLITEKRGVFDIIKAVWDGDQDYQMTVSEDGVVEVKSTLTLANDLSNVVNIKFYLLVGIGLLLVTWLSIFFFSGSLVGEKSTR
jgi:mannosyltransferase